MRDPGTHPALFAEHILGQVYVRGCYHYGRSEYHWGVWLPGNGEDSVSGCRIAPYRVRGDTRWVENVRVAHELDRIAKLSEKALNLNQR